MISLTLSVRAVSSAAVLAVALAGCSRTQPEVETKKDPAAAAPATAASGAELNSGLGSKPPAAAKAGDPLEGKFTLADATKDIPGTGALIATMDTSEGELKCKLLEDKAPTTVANFVGLATGARTWQDPKGAWVNRPAYDGTTFHRIIKGFMIQGGDAKGNGSGEPGYVIPDEKWAGGKHDRAGLLCMANRGPNTNGAQFFITDAAAAHLDVSYTIFGECSPVDTIHKIAGVKVRGESPETPVTIKSVKVAREKPGKAGAKDAAK
ncbi:peptidylprolyl isomerase [Pendulispora rubella]|uniref:Peptidyl-prolyl cis-trans isomerase n=1 Tax=Pendulispora rubella TaxID=2741070 RepID=A0ABZ2LAX4_9BACT